MSLDKNTIIACAATAAATAAITCMVCKNSCSPSSKKEEDNEPTVSRDRYETEYLTRQYLEFHFTTGHETFKHRLEEGFKLEDAYDFPTRLAEKFRKFKPAKNGVCMDLGCAVGATSFEMARDFDKVIGIDLSKAFIDQAELVRKNGKIAFAAPEQGQLSVNREFTVPAEIDRSKIHFAVGDALNIDPSFGNFDGLLAANLLCRVPDGEKLINQFETRINSGGILVLVSPYSWSEDATKITKWFGGTANGRRSEVVVKERLSKTFELLDERTEPFMIRDHGRRFQLGFSHCTVWRRK